MAMMLIHFFILIAEHPPMADQSAVKSVNL
jgi:hypothetical protein